jgi:hypothetical protein
MSPKLSPKPCRRAQIAGMRSGLVYTVTREPTGAAT